VIGEQALWERHAFHKLEGCRSSSTPPPGGESTAVDRTAHERPADEGLEADMSATIVEPVVLPVPRVLA
jgi:hypothetical protein